MVLASPHMIGGDEVFSIIGADCCSSGSVLLSEAFAIDGFD